MPSCSVQHASLLSTGCLSVSNSHVNLVPSPWTTQRRDVSVLSGLKALTGGIGPDSCIGAVGFEAHSSELKGVYDKVKTALMMETDRPIVLRQAIQAVRKGGTLSILGVYGELLDKVPFGAAFGKGINIKIGNPTCTTI